MPRFGAQVLSLLLSLCLLAPSAAVAQDGGLKVVIVSGEGGINNIEKRVVVEPIVEVQDADGRPVPKAVVTFRSPATGPSVTFFGASRVSTVTTDESGRAQAAGMIPNTEEGSFYIDVEAKQEGRTATARITQTNAYAPGEPKRKSSKWRWWALLGTGAAISITAAALAGGGSSDPTPTTLTFNGVNVGAPR